MKFKEEIVSLVVSTILSVIITMVLESYSATNPLILFIYAIIIVLANYFFEKIHANKRAIFGGNKKPIISEVVLSSVITFFILFISIYFLTLIKIFNQWYLPVLCSFSIICGYIINYVRFKGKKGVYILLFTSNKKIKERITLYQFESLYDKENITVLDILTLYGYVSLKEIEDARLIFKTTNLSTIEELLIRSGEITKEDLEEAEYILEKYNETQTFMSKEEFRNYKIERQMVLSRLKGE